MTQTRRVRPRNRDRAFLLIFAGAVLCVIVIASILAPKRLDNDRSPSTDNAGTRGARAAYLLLDELGYKVGRNEQPMAQLDALDAAHTTLVLADPFAVEDDAKPANAAVMRFLQRGGRVLATGDEGAQFLPGQRTSGSTQPFQALCTTVPEGRGRLASVGPVAMYADVRWAATEPVMHVEQWCGRDAVVVSMHVGAGEAVWWSSSEPLNNRGIRQSSSLALLLASVGDPSRRVLFDEYYHGARATRWDATKGLPLRILGLQAALVVALLLWSFSRRSGPVRPLVRLPRTSPIEFAESMGALYQRAGATDTATECARLKLIEFLETRCGLPRECTRSSPEVIAEAVHARFHIDTIRLQHDLQQADAAKYQRSNSRDALVLVKALHQHVVDLNDVISRPMPVAAGGGER